MGNRKKSQKEKRDRFLAKIKGKAYEPEQEMRGERIRLPESEKIVAKIVPATIHWKDWPANDRTDSEVIGETVVYEDGTFDMVINRDISDEAKAFANAMQAKDPVSITLAKEN